MEPSHSRQINYEHTTVMEGREAEADSFGPEHRSVNKADQGQIDQPPDQKDRVVPYDKNLAMGGVSRHTPGGGGCCGFCKGETHISKSPGRAPISGVGLSIDSCVTLLPAPSSSTQISGIALHFPVSGIIM